MQWLGIQVNAFARVSTATQWINFQSWWNRLLFWLCRNSIHMSSTLQLAHSPWLFSGQKKRMKEAPPTIHSAWQCGCQHAHVWTDHFTVLAAQLLPSKGESAAVQRAWEMLSASEPRWLQREIQYFLHPSSTPGSRPLRNSSEEYCDLQLTFKTLGLLYLFFRMLWTSSFSCPHVLCRRSITGLLMLAQSHIHMHRHTLRQISLSITINIS